MHRSLLAIGLGWLLVGTLSAAEPTRDEASAALLKAVTFFHQHVARHGGYVYASSGDLKQREGEGIVAPDTIWVQPPGTPAVGEAFLSAYTATNDPRCLAAARDAGQALVRGQLQSGGWHYSITFNEQERAEHFYRTDVAGKPRTVELPKKKVVDKNGQPLPAGWDTWKNYRIRGNQTTLDDDTTQAATRFLCRLDRTLDFKDATIHEAAQYALKSLLAAQYPNGGWSANYDRFPVMPPSERDYPLLPASLPETWSQTWPKDFTGCYVTNDDLMRDMLETLLLAHEIYRDEQYLQAARRAGDFLILAQLPDPQPAWAQQYDQQMQPCWCRAFEPPAVTGGESQGIIAALMLLYRHTGESKYLKPIPRAIAYLRKSQLPGGKLARFYEVQTNRPIYFTRASGKHEPTYSNDDIAAGYGYVVDARLDGLEKQYETLLKTPRDKLLPPRGKPSAPSAAVVASVINSLDQRGAWNEHRRLPHHKVYPASGVIDSAVFIKNIEVLSRAVGKAE